MELDDFTLPVEYDGDWAAFLEASQGGFSSIRRINLFAFRSPEPKMMPEWMELTGI